MCWDDDLNGVCEVILRKKKIFSLSVKLFFLSFLVFIIVVVWSWKIRDWKGKVLYFLIVLKFCFEVVIIWDKSCFYGGVGDIVNVIVVVWNKKKIKEI